MAKQNADQNIHNSGAGQTNPFSEMEKEVLNFWEKNKIFKKSVASPPTPLLNRRGRNRDYVFYDGPPFATGTPHYGHIVGSIMKDVVPRYWTMQGYRVERKWGWDCHGLPIENIVEKEMGSKSKKDIEKIGVEKFNELCRSKVLGYVDEWKKVITRLGRWADMENSYKTMDLNYMESVWWVFKELYDKGLIYEGYRTIHICTRCETTLSQMEVSEGYKTVKDISVIVKFKIKDNNFLDKYCEGKPTNLLAWTTTPWSLPTTMALAIGEDFNYVVIKHDGEQSIFVKDRIEYVKSHLKGAAYKIIKEVKGKELEGILYEHPFAEFYLNHPEVKGNNKVFKTYITNYVSVEDGTGIVTINGAFGEIDRESAKKIGLPVIVNVKMDGTFTEEMGQFAGLSVKPAEDIQKTDIEIIKYLAYHNLLFSKEKYEHSYPHCWRCETPLINYATTSWFVNILKIKDKMLETAKEINWSPNHIKEGRFGKWLEGARDWSISRQRFWASVIPIWRCAPTRTHADFNADSRGQCGNMKVLRSVKELEELSGEKITDLHKHIVDKITFKCEKCGGTMKRVPDVLDCWFESGSMPYAQMHYPFENKEKFEKNFPAEFIAEGIDQTRAWFYYLHSIANGIKNTHAFKNVIVNGIVLTENGKKMAKRLNNYPDPMFIFDKYGADALRYYLITSPVMLAEDLNFAEKGVQESLRNVVMTLWNVYKFYELFSPTPRPSPVATGEGELLSDNVLDKWILARLNQLISEATGNMNNYNLPKAARPIEDFVNDFSTWYLRRSRERFKGDDESDKQAALNTTKFVLLELAKVMAPFMPFVAENLWQKVTGNDFKDEDKSVHLEQWPSQLKIKNYELKIIDKMKAVREAARLGLSARDLASLKVRQPLSLLYVDIKDFDYMEENLTQLVKDEVNVKDIQPISDQTERAIKRDRGIVRVKDGLFKGRYANDKDGMNFVSLKLDLTPELKLEGVKRELARSINNLRKDARLTIKDRAVVYYKTKSKDVKEVFKKMGKDIMKDTLSDEIVEGAKEADFKKEIKIDGEEIILGIKKK